MKIVLKVSVISRVIIVFVCIVFVGDMIYPRVTHCYLTEVVLEGKYSMWFQYKSSKQMQRISSHFWSILMWRIEQTELKKVATQSGAGVFVFSVLNEAKLLLWPT